TAPDAARRAGCSGFLPAPRAWAWRCAAMRPGGMQSSSSVVPHNSGLVALPVALLDGMTLVDVLLAAGKSKFDLRPAPAVEIDGKRNERHVLSLNRPWQAGNLAFVQQQLPGPLGFMFEAVAMAEFRDVGIDQPRLAIADFAIGFRDRAFAEAQAFHYRPGQRDAGLEL